MQYPHTPVKKVEEVLYDRKIVDNYRWLEDSSDPYVQKWIKQQNKFTDDHIDADLRQKFQGELKASFNFVSVSSPLKCGQLYFWTERQPDQQQNVLYVKKGLKGDRRVLVDPNLLGGKKVVALDYWYPSDEGEYLAYGTSTGGNELSKLSVLDVDSGKNLEDVAQNASWASLAWLPDAKGFYYTAHPVPGTVPAGEERLHHRVCLHILGDKQDQEIFGAGRNKKDILGVKLSIDGKMLAISSQRDWVQNEVYLYCPETGQTKPLITGLKGNFWVSFSDQQVLLYTNYRVQNAKILKAPIDKLPTRFSDWQEVVPEKEQKIEWYDFTPTKIIIAYIKDAVVRAEVYSYNGKKLSDLPLPKNASLLSTQTSKGDEEFFYKYASFVDSGAIVRYDPAKNDYEEYNRGEANINPSDYVVTQEWFKSKDGTKVPMFIIRHKKMKLDGRNPTILYGYGGFESSLTPWFLRGSIPWLEHGGIYVIANIRGGGEFGKKWHTGGILANKQKSYDDFIAAAEHLVASRYTSPDYLGILGASNGGLLVSAVAVQRPDLFKAVESEVPLTDMVRFPLSFIAGRWVAEYGDPKKAKDLKNILKFSPYHNVRQEQQYPAFLFTTARQDTRVDPMHARKMTALLQNTGSDNIVLLHTDMNSGHAGSLTMDHFYAEKALKFAFFATLLGLKV